ncbi:hypothetical protein IWW57_000733 [Coemansia sp. S610]|nr:hypothetical protein IWW57_000733 [Coemansia sp. S610]
MENMPAAYANYSPARPRSSSPPSHAMPSRSLPESSHYHPYSKNSTRQYASYDNQYVSQRQSPPRGSAYHHQPSQAHYYSQQPRFQQAPPPPPAVPQQPQNTTYSSQIIQETGCHLYRYNSNGDTVEQSLHQIVGSNGKVYIEYIPGHSLVYVPSSVSPSLVINQAMANSRLAKLKEKTPKNARPSNVFFKYRSYKLPELTLKYPKYNQTVISQMVAEHWKVESEEVKNRFKQQYKDEMVKYDIAKKISRHQASTMPRDYLCNDSSDNLPTYLPYSIVPVPASGLPLVDLHSAGLPQSAAQSHRSHTLPTSSSPQEQPQHHSFSRHSF